MADAPGRTTDGIKITDSTDYTLDIWNSTGSTDYLFISARPPRGADGTFNSGYAVVLDRDNMREIRDFLTAILEAGNE